VGRSLRERLVLVPDAIWLAAIVVVSAAARIWLGRDMPAPFVFVDELIYSELARSLSDSGSFAVRGVPTTGYSILYPALIAPAYWLFDGLTSAYAAAKATNAIAMSLAAVPAWLLARRVIGRWLALLAAALAVAVPSMAYTATLVTENLFYPLALAFAWALVRVLERPSWARVAVLAVTLGAALATRSQALGFVGAIVLAPLVLALVRRDARTIRPFLPLLGGIVALGLLVLGVQLARGRSLSDLLGAYSVVVEGDYDVDLALRFWLWHVEELALYLGVVPVVALVVLLARGGRLPARLQEHLAATVALVVTSTLVVATFASRFAPDRIQDRYLFFLTPLLVVALLAWVELGAPRPRVALAVGAVAVTALVVAFPYVRFIGEPAKSDTFGVLPLWSANEHLLGDSYRLTVLAGTILLVALMAFVPARLAVAVPLALLLLFAVLSRPVWSGPQGVLRSGEGALFQGIRTVERDWIDSVVPAPDDVIVLWTGRADRFTVNQNEFFNRRVGDVYYTSSPTPGGIGETAVTIDPADGTVRTADGGTIDAAYALLDGSVIPDGHAVARDDGLGTTLWRLSGPLASTTKVTGLYPNDTWSGPRATWKRVRCKGGELIAALHSDPTLFAGRITDVLATVAGRPVARMRVPPEGSVSMRVPLEPVDDTCTVRFTVSPTLVPAEVLSGSTDDRQLGVHFDSFVHEEPA
jgi:4-amino-4-deoxy-L-arabinose transferase-like glycosyltransferase